MNKKTTDVVAYIGFIGWIIAYCAGTREESKFHLNQALVLAIAGVICGVVPILGWFASVAVLVFMIMGIVSAANGEEKELPLIGKIQLLK